MDSSDRRPRNRHTTEPAWYFVVSTETARSFLPQHWVRPALGVRPAPGPAELVEGASTVERSMPCRAVPFRPPAGYQTRPSTADLPLRRQVTRAARRPGTGWN